MFDLLDAAKTEEEVAFETKVKELTVVRGDIAVSVMDAHTLSQFNVVESAAAKAAFLVRRALFDRVEDAEVDFTSEDNEAIKRTVYAVNLNGT